MRAACAVAAEAVTYCCSVEHKRGPERLLRIEAVDPSHCAYGQGRKRWSILLTLLAMGRRPAGRKASKYESGERQHEKLLS